MSTQQCFESLEDGIYTSLHASCSLWVRAWIQPKRTQVSGMSAARRPAHLNTKLSPARLRLAAVTLGCTYPFPKEGSNPHSLFYHSEHLAAGCSTMLELYPEAVRRGVREDTAAVQVMGCEDKELDIQPRAGLSWLHPGRMGSRFLWQQPLLQGRAHARWRALC